MFSALRNDTGETIYTIENDKEYLKGLCSSGLILCPDCNTLMNIRSGTKQQHFYHIALDKCTNLYGEPETVEHLAGKLIIYNFLKENYPNSEVYLEYRIEETNQRSDVIVLHKNGERWAFEFQCSKIKHEILIERHQLYLSANVKDFWILNDDIHTYGITEGKEDREKHRLCGLERAIFDISKELCYLNTTNQDFRIIKRDIWILNTMLNGKDYCTPFNAVSIVDGSWCTLEDIRIKNEREAKLRKANADKEYLENNYTKVNCFKIVDYYFPSGRKYRGTISVVDFCVNGTMKFKKLIRDLETEKPRVLQEELYPIGSNKKKRIKVAYKEFVDIPFGNAIVDLPMDWIVVDGEIKFSREELETIRRHSISYFEYRYVWWSAKEKWFVPKEYKDLEWDDDYLKRIIDVYFRKHK